MTSVYQSSPNLSAHQAGIGGAGQTQLSYGGGGSAVRRRRRTNEITTEHSWLEGTTASEVWVSLEWLGTGWLHEEQPDKRYLFLVETPSDNNPFAC